jgi:hypothetical protein
MDFWRSEAYTKFFEFLDSKGGFYYEVRIPTHDLIESELLAAMGRRAGP